jgi:hypothetical protein
MAGTGRVHFLRATIFPPQGLKPHVLSNENGTAEARALIRTLKNNPADYAQKKLCFSGFFVAFVTCFVWHKIVASWLSP